MLLLCKNHSVQRFTSYFPCMLLVFNNILSPRQLCKNGIHVCSAPFALTCPRHLVVRARESMNEVRERKHASDPQLRDSFLCELQSERGITISFGENKKERERQRE